MSARLSSRAPTCSPTNSAMIRTSTICQHQRALFKLKELLIRWQANFQLSLLLFSALALAETNHVLIYKLTKNQRQRRHFNLRSCETDPNFSGAIIDYHDPSQPAIQPDSICLDNSEGCIPKVPLCVHWSHKHVGAFNLDSKGGELANFACRSVA